MSIKIDSDRYWPLRRPAAPRIGNYERLLECFVTYCAGECPLDKTEFVYQKEFCLWFNSNGIKSDQNLS